MKNVYFSHGTTNEQRLYEDLIIESLQIYGHEVYYLPREIVKEDRVFREDILSKFDERYLIEMYLLSYDGFQGDGALLTKFGVRVSEEATFIVSRRVWEERISKSQNLVSKERPNEGDVIYFPLTGQLFQIKFVDHQNPFRQLNYLPTYNLICETMELSDERFETGLEEIDEIREKVGYSITFTMNSGGTLDYQVGELVEGSVSGATGKVVGWNASSKKLEVIDIVGAFKDNETIEGQTTGSMWIIDTFNSIENENDDFNENQWFEDEGDSIVDWSDTNPFGEHSNMGVF